MSYKDHLRVKDVFKVVKRCLLGPLPLQCPEGPMAGKDVLDRPHLSQKCMIVKEVHEVHYLIDVWGII